MGDETPQERIFRIMQENAREMVVSNRAMQETMANMTQMMAHMMRERGAGPRDEQPRLDDRGMKIEVPEFDGSSMDPEVYLEWERSLERFFEYKGTPEDQKFKLAKLKIVKQASTWLIGLQKQRERENRERIQTWPKLKKSLRRKFVPSNYQQSLYVKWSSLRQAKMSVADYVKEFERLIISCDIEEREEMKTGRFIGGLNDDIRERLETHPNVTYDDACKLAVVYEKQRKKGTSFYDSKAKKEEAKASNSETKSSTTPPPEVSKGKKVTKDSDLSDIVCFKCRGRGHYAKDCANPRALSTREVKKIATQVFDFDNSSEVEFSGDEIDPKSASSKQQDGDEEEGEHCFPEQQVLVLRRTLKAKVAKNDSEQRTNLFQTKCRVQSELCDLIIDGGSEVNAISKELVESLCLKTMKHPIP